jgi:hypothetical protein
MTDADNAGNETGDLLEQTTGDVASDPGGYLAISLLIVIIVLVALLAMALIISA